MKLSLLEKIIIKTCGKVTLKGMPDVDILTNSGYMQSYDTVGFFKNGKIVTNNKFSFPVEEFPQVFLKTLEMIKNTDENKLQIYTTYNKNSKDCSFLILNEEKNIQLKAYGTYWVNEYKEFHISNASIFYRCEETNPGWFDSISLGTYDINVMRNIADELSRKFFPDFETKRKEKEFQKYIEETKKAQAGKYLFDNLMQKLEMETKDGYSKVD